MHRPVAIHTEADLICLLPNLVDRGRIESMHSENSERANAESRAVEQALSRIGEPITEAQAKVVALEDCECKEGMFALAATRRRLFSGAGLVAAVGMTAMLPRNAAAKA